MSDCGWEDNTRGTRQERSWDEKLSEAQRLQVWSEVTGYLGLDVTLLCQFIKGSNEIISQVQWYILPPGGYKTSILVFNTMYGLNISESPLKGRVNISEQSLIIRNVEMSDAGLYSCSVTTFPSGSFEKSTNLIVQEQKLLSSGEISAIAVVVVLLMAVMAAVAYFTFIRRSSSIRQHVYIDTSGPVQDVARTSDRDQNVVYSDVKFKPSRDTVSLSRNTTTETAPADDITYSEVAVLHRQPK